MKSNLLDSIETLNSFQCRVSAGESTHSRQPRSLLLPGLKAQCVTRRGFLSMAHEIAGMANSSRAPNAEFVDVGYDTILEAKMDMRNGTEV